MNFTFGIITNGIVDTAVIDSIKKQNISNFEIIIVGGSPLAWWDKKNYDGAKHIEFDESSGNYTVKKNIITKNSSFDNIVYMHDYYMLDDNWYSGFLKFGDDWDICMNIIENKDGTRFRDWCVWDDPDICFPGGGIHTSENPNHRIVLPNYDYNKKEYMYISGGYWISKKYIMEIEPINESLDWGHSEDIEWSKRVLSKYNYKMNKYSKVKLLKEKRLSAEYME